MVASIVVIFLFASVADLNSASNVFKAKSTAILMVADVQLFIAVVYVLAGLYLAILLKRLSPKLGSAAFGLWYIAHLLLFIVPPFVYFLLLVLPAIISSHF